MDNFSGMDNLVNFEKTKNLVKLDDEINLRKKFETGINLRKNNFIKLKNLSSELIKFHSIWILNKRETIERENHSLIEKKQQILLI